MKLWNFRNSVVNNPRFQRFQITWSSLRTKESTLRVGQSHADLSEGEVHFFAWPWCCCSNDIFYAKWTCWPPNKKKSKKQSASLFLRSNTEDVDRWFDYCNVVSTGCFEIFLFSTSRAVDYFCPWYLLWKCHVTRWNVELIRRQSGKWNWEYPTMIKVWWRMPGSLWAVTFFGSKVLS